MLRESDSSCLPIGILNIRSTCTWLIRGPLAELMWWPAAPSAFYGPYRLKWPLRWHVKHTGCPSLDILSDRPGPQTKCVCLWPFFLSACGLVILLAKVRPRVATGWARNICSSVIRTFAWIPVPLVVKSLTEPIVWKAWSSYNPRIRSVSAGGAGNDLRCW